LLAEAAAAAESFAAASLEDSVLEQAMKAKMNNTVVKQRIFFIQERV
jgi:hypothetical protein